MIGAVRRLSKTRFGRWSLAIFGGLFVIPAVALAGASHFYLGAGAAVFLGAAAFIWVIGAVVERLTGPTSDVDTADRFGRAVQIRVDIYRAVPLMFVGSFCLTVAVHYLVAAAR